MYIHFIIFCQFIFDNISPLCVTFVGNLVFPATCNFCGNLFLLYATFVVIFLPKKLYCLAIYPILTKFLLFFLFMTTFLCIFYSKSCTLPDFALKRLSVFIFYNISFIISQNCCIFCHFPKKRLSVFIFLQYSFHFFKKILYFLFSNFSLIKYFSILVQHFFQFSPKNLYFLFSNFSLIKYFSILIQHFSQFPQKNLYFLFSDFSLIIFFDFSTTFFSVFSKKLVL